MKHTTEWLREALYGMALPEQDQVKAEALRESAAVIGFMQGEIRLLLDMLRDDVLCLTESQAASRKLSH